MDYFSIGASLRRAKGCRRELVRGARGSRARENHATIAVAATGPDGNTRLACPGESCEDP